MNLVIVESPFAPQTPLPEGGCELFKGSGMCLYMQPRPTPDGEPCPYCKAFTRRNWESARNARYLDACLRDCLRRGEAPFASHGLYTRPGVFDDTKEVEREAGIRAGFAWREVAWGSIFYVDLGWSRGMREGQAHALDVSRRRWAETGRAHFIVSRELGEGWDK